MADDARPAGAGAVQQPAWPPLPEVTSGDPQADVKKIRYQAQVQAALAQQQAASDAQTAQAAADVEATKAAWASEYAMRQAVQAAYLDVAKGAIDRAQSRAQFIQTASAAVSTAYAAILALSFKADSSSPTLHPLPTQGVVPTTFLGLAIALATVYLSYITQHPGVTGPAAGASLDENQERRVDAFVGWTAALVVPRLPFLHAAVVSLAVGVALLPIAYLPLTSVQVAAVAAGAALVVLVVSVVPVVVGGRTLPRS